MRLREITHQRSPLIGAHFGLEVEVEGMRALRDRLAEREVLPSGKYWRVIRDGSLRNAGVELVSSAIPADELPRALDALGKVLHAEGNSPDFSRRTSTHVHVNVQDLSIHQIQGLLVLAVASERILQEFVLPERRANLFCTPMTACSTLPRLLQASYQENATGRLIEAAQVLHNIGKYSAVNTGRLLDLGTVEFRTMHGAANLQEVHNWCTVLGRLRSLAAELSSFEDVFTVLARGPDYLRRMLLTGLVPPHSSTSGYTSTDNSAVAVALALATGAKAQEARSGQYAYCANSAPWEQAALNNREWRNVVRDQLRDYRMPGEALLESVYNNTRVGESRFDILRLPNGVAFLITNSLGSSTVIMRYIPPTRSAEIREQVTFYMELGD